MNKIIVRSIDTENDICVFDCINDRDPNNLETKTCTRTIEVAKQFIGGQKSAYETGIATLTAEISNLNTELEKFPV